MSPSRHADRKRSPSKAKAKTLRAKAARASPEKRYLRAIRMSPEAKARKEAATKGFGLGYGQEEQHPFVIPEAPKTRHSTLFTPIGGKDQAFKMIAVMILSVILLTSVTTLIFFSFRNFGTGLVTFIGPEDLGSGAIEGHTERLLGFDNITGVKLSGSMRGVGARFTLRTSSEEYLVADVNPGSSPASEYNLTTDKKTYSLGETVQVITNQENNSDASVYIHYDEEAMILGSDAYTPAQTGNYSAVMLVATESDIIRLEVNFTVVDEGLNMTGEPQDVARHTNDEDFTFTNLCEETCEINATNKPTLIIEPFNGTNVTLTEIKLTILQANTPPQQAILLGAVSLQIGVARQLDLSPYFTDPDEDQVHYDISQLDGVEADVQGSTLTLVAQGEGSWTARIYATDGTHMTTSNEFTITAGASPVPEDNPSSNDSSNDTLTIVDEIQPQSSLAGSNNQSPNSVVPVAECDKPLNERPSYCFSGVEQQAFKNVAAQLDFKDLGIAGRFTRFGNLVIKGVLIEESTSSPGPDDFKVGYAQRVGYEDETIYTAWISRDGGDLHLKGRLYEERETLSPKQFNTYNIKNPIGILLAYIDESTGDLYLRGNLVQLGDVTK